MSTDRFLHACRGEPVDATPVWFMRQAGRSLPEYRRIRERHDLLEITRLPEVCAEVTLQPVRRHGVDAAILYADITLPFSGIGFEFEIREGVGPVVFDPIDSPADVKRLRPFEPAAEVAPLLEAIGAIRRESPVPLIGFAGAPFTLASYLVEGRPTRTFARVKAFMLSEPAAWRALMDHLVDTTIVYLGAQVEAGVQAVQLFDSWVGSLSPDDYRTSVQPFMRRLFDALPDVPTIHFGTDTTGLLPLMAEAGGDVMGVDWRVDLDRARRLVGDRPVQGNLDPTVVAEGPWEVVAARARAVLERAGGRPGHIFNLGHGVLPHTPVEHLQRLVELVHTETEWTGSPAEAGSRAEPTPHREAAG
ncbi:MAG TPA: uroporphyrinogen decarboxylase [Gemmatimonadota bacterium]|nr:uroporphyrinogen decarboxylase [Gemmatimonadota bacterium]